MQTRGRRALGVAVSLGLGLLLLNPLRARAADKPDLVVSTLSDPPATARAGDSFALTSTVTNQGLGTAAVSTTTKFYLVVGSTRVKNLKGVQVIGPLGPGESDGATVALSVYSDTDVGTFNIQGCGDGDGDVSESNESNNCTTTLATITILESPDLVVTSISNPVSSAGQGQAITVKSTFKNIGPVDGRAHRGQVLPGLDDGRHQAGSEGHSGRPAPQVRPDVQRGTVHDDPARDPRRAIQAAGLRRHGQDVLGGERAEQLPDLDGEHPGHAAAGPDGDVGDRPRSPHDRCCPAPACRSRWS